MVGSTRGDARPRIQHPRYRRRGGYPAPEILGFDIGKRIDEAGGPSWRRSRSSGATVPVAIVPWNEPLDRGWRALVLEGIRADARWCFCCNGAALRIVDAHHTWSRHYLEFDLALLSRERRPPGGPLERDPCRRAGRAARRCSIAPALSARHGVAVCKALGDGVLDALGLLLTALAASRPDHTPQVLFEHSLTVLYRLLFLLFAEARGLVPLWHPVYRDRYSIDAIVTTLDRRAPVRGLWHALQAISRLAHAGCAAGEL